MIGDLVGSDVTGHLSLVNRGCLALFADMPSRTLVVGPLTTFGNVGVTAECDSLQRRHDAAVRFAERYRVVGVTR